MSASTGSAHVTLDCRGMKCPRPVIELAKRFSELELGEIIEILADDPAAAPDLAAWCRMRDQELVTSRPPRYVIRRRK